VGIDKSANPLTNTIAGPIPGVNITEPRPLEPRDNVKIAVGLPITLQLENASTSGVRPLSYLIEIATDANFTNIVFQREGITPGEAGRTTFRLPDALPSDRTYYWRVRAQDGANTGPFSTPVFFVVFTPVVIQKPALISPTGNEQVSSLVPQFTIGNAPRSGPARAVSYEVEVATGDSFANRIAIWTLSEKSGQTVFSAPASLPPSTQLYWRARGFDPTVDPIAVGPFSDAAAFRTPAATTSTPVPLGGSCSGSPEQILNCRRSQFPGHMSESQIVSFLKGSASDINKSGSAGGPWGILVKTSGTNCNGYSCDILCLGNGGSQIQRDVLLDAEGSQTPIWGSPMSGSEIAVRQCEAQ
jgi:hypothetical protein